MLNGNGTRLKPVPCWKCSKVTCRVFDYRGPCGRPCEALEATANTKASKTTTLSSHKKRLVRVLELKATELALGLVSPRPDRSYKEKG